MNISSVKLKNFLSYGNNWTEFFFENGVVRITGKNGEGKSCLVEALFYGFTGKPYRDINLSQLVNSINKKELEVHINFSINNTFYRIERGIKPNVFKIYKKEGEAPSTSEEDLIPLASASRSYQQMFEEDHLKFPAAKILDQVAIKSMTRNLSFLSLTKAEKREVVENMLDIKVFTEMNKLAKTKVDALEKDLVDMKKTLEHSRLLMDQERANINRLMQIKEQQQRDLEQKASKIEREVMTIESDTHSCITEIGTLTSRISKREEEIEKKQQSLQAVDEHKTKKAQLQDVIKQVEVSITEFNPKFEKMKGRITKLEDMIRDWKSAISISENKVKFLTSTCGGCAKIDQISVADNLSGMKSNVEKAYIKITECKDEIESYNASIDLLRMDIKSYNNQISECDSAISAARTMASEIEMNKQLNSSDQSTINRNNQRIEQNKQRIESLRTSVTEEKKQEIVIDETKLNDYQSKQEELTQKYNEKAKLKKHYVYARKLLADDAIKAFVVNKYLPSINLILNTYLQKFGTTHPMNLDNEFNEVFTGRFRESFTYCSLSEGQKKRVDLSIMFMWRKFCQTKFQQADLNALLLDEVSSGLDVETQEILSQMLKDLAREENKCIITISHDTKVDPEKIDHLYEAKIESGFSKLTKLTL